MKIDDLNSIIRLAGIKRKLVEAEARINPLTRKITDPDAEPDTAASAPAAPAADAAPAAPASKMYPPGTQFAYVTPQSPSSNSGSSSSGDLPWAVKPSAAPAAPAAAPKPAVAPAAGGSGIAQELDRQYREIMAARKRAGLDAPTKPGPAAAAPAAGTSSTPQQAASQRTLLPVDPELKKVQATIAKVPKFKELLGKFGEAGDGVDGRMGPLTKAAIITYLEYVPDAATTPEFKAILDKYKIPVPPPLIPPRGAPATPAAPAAAPKGPNGEPLVKNASGVTGYMKQQGRSQTFVPYTPPVKENTELAELIRLTHSLR